MELAMVGVVLFAGILVLTTVVLGFQLVLGEPLTTPAVLLLLAATLFGCGVLWARRPPADAVDPAPNRVRGY